MSGFLKKVTVLAIFVFALPIMAKEQTIRKPSKVIPSYMGYVGKPRTPKEDPKQGGNLNRFFNKYSEGDIVSLAIILDDDQREDMNQKPDEYNRLIFTVMDNYASNPTDENSGGCEYLIHLKSKKDRGYNYSPTTGKLAGIFKITEIDGPNQGILSINLKPMR